MGKAFHDANEVKLATSEGSFIVFTKIDIMRAFYFNSVKFLSFPQDFVVNCSYASVVI